MAGIPLGNLQPNYQSWSDVPPGERNFISGLFDQWNQSVGYTVQIPQWALIEMANLGINSAFAVGQYMWAHISDQGRDTGAYFVPPQAVMNSPWAAFGLGADAFKAAYTSYQQTLKELTGGTGDWGQFSNLLTQQGGQMNAAWLRGNLMQDPEMLKTYGWLRYGVDYTQFQTQKLQWGHLFGKDLTNDEGVAQLQYLHQAQGAGHEARQTPTLSQEEKRKANVGPSDNVVR